MNPIGNIQTPYRQLADMPIQPVGARDAAATVIIDPRYRAGLRDLDGFSHIYLIYLFHLSKGYDLSVTPFLDNRAHGLFATRAPRRPNPIGLSLVELTEVRGCELTVRGADVINGTPLLDIKPYIETFDQVNESRSGWVDVSTEQLGQKRSDDRFID